MCRVSGQCESTLLSFCFYSWLLLLFPGCYRVHPALSFLHTVLFGCLFVFAVFYVCCFGSAHRERSFTFFVENETCYMAPFSSVRALSLARLRTARFKIFPHILVGCGTSTTNHDDDHHHLTSPLAVRPPAEKGWTHEAGWRRL